MPPAVSREMGGNGERAGRIDAAPTTPQKNESRNGGKHTGRGVRVPQDIRVASLYDSSALAESSPAITAVQFDAYALGRKATQQLLQALKGREVETRVELGYQVSMRESTKT